MWSLTAVLEVEGLLVDGALLFAVQRAADLLASRPCVCVARAPLSELLWLRVLSESGRVGGGDCGSILFFMLLL